MGGLFSERLGSCCGVGVELCGAIKNVLAIACGVIIGRGLGENARAALITRGLTELRRLALALGASPETPMSLAGLGDLTLTCTSAQSRNYALGLALGKNETPDKGKLAEGLFTASAVLLRAEAVGVEMPICTAIDAVLNHGATIDETMISLLSRPIKTEMS